MRARAVEELLGIFLESISEGHQEEVTSRATGGGVGVGAEEKSEWIPENNVLRLGKSNVEGTTDGSKLAYNNT